MAAVAFPGKYFLSEKEMDWRRFSRPWRCVPGVRFKISRKSAPRRPRTPGEIPPYLPGRTPSFPRHPDPLAKSRTGGFRRPGGTGTSVKGKTPPEKMFSGGRDPLKRKSCL